MAQVSWGKPTLYYKDLDESTPKWRLAPTPAEGTTSIETSKGDKKEAKIEGGENEDVKYNKSTYALTFDIRATKNRKKIVSDEDGVVAHNYAFAVVPEDSACYGILIEKSNVSVETKYSAEDGVTHTYTVDALKPASGNQVKFGIINVTTQSGVISISCEEEEVQS